MNDWFTSQDGQLVSQPSGIAACCNRVARHCGIIPRPCWIYAIRYTLLAPQLWQSQNNVKIIGCNSINVGHLHAGPSAPPTLNSP